MVRGLESTGVVARRRLVVRCGVDRCHWPPSHAQLALNQDSPEALRQDEHAGDPAGVLRVQQVQAALERGRRPAPRRQATRDCASGACGLLSMPQVVHRESQRGLYAEGGLAQPHHLPSLGFRV